MTNCIVKDFFAQYPGPFAYAPGTDGTENCFDVICTTTNGTAFSTYYWYQVEDAEMRAATLTEALNTLREKRNVESQEG